jgi:2-iminobutanoate/2-iminopropanoate deaminase
MLLPPVRYPRDATTPVSHLPFSPCVVVGGLVFVSGQASVDATGTIVTDSFEGEFRRSIDNLARILATAGSDLRHVVQTRNYVRDASDLPLYNKFYAETFAEPYPARTTIVNCLPRDLRYEIEAIAFVCHRHRDE